MGDRKNGNGRNTVKVSIEDETAHLRGLGFKGLRMRWQSVFQRPAPDHLPRHLLFRILAYQIQAESQGAQLDVYRFADHGVPTVSTSIFASNSYLKENPDLVKKFVAASLKGWGFAIAKSKEALESR